MLKWVAHLGVVISLLFIAMGLSIIGMNIPPVLGLFIGAPVFVLAAYFFSAPRSQECTL